MTRTRQVEVINRKGLHARASAKLAKLAAHLPTPVQVAFEGETADARSIMDLLCLGAGLGATVTLTADGEAADDELAQIADLFDDGFGELSEDT